MSTVLDVSRVTVRFGALRALDDVSLCVQQGHNLGVVGPNGAGKTTLLNVVSGYLPAATGSIALFGVPVSRTPPHALAAMGVGRSFQLADQFGRLSVEDFMLLGLSCRLEATFVGTALRSRRVRREEEEARETVRTQLELFGMGDLRLSRSLQTLPYGIRKRLDLARAAIGGPRLLLVDEPTSGLSARECDEVAALLRTLHVERGISLLVVDHRVKFVTGLCNTLLALDFGRVIGSGPADEVLATEQVQQAYFGRTRDVLGEGGTAGDQPT